MAVLAGGKAHAACTITAGMTGSQLQTAINSCSSGSTASFPAGNFGPVTSTITIPCGVSLAGPTVPYSQTPNQTATISGASSFIGWGFQTTAGCSATQTIQYLAWDGKLPSNGGGFLNVVPGTTNLIVENNWLHGVNAPGWSTGSFNNQADLIFLNGGSGNPTTSNVTIQWNIFGSTSFADCATAMNDTTGAEDDNGGGCGGVGIHNNVANVSVLNNIFHWLEEPIKVFESPSTGSCNPLTVNYNSVTNFSRIGFETQCYTPGPNLMYIQYNNWGTRYNHLQSYGISAANGCGAGVSCVTHTDYNVYLEAAAGPADTGIEVWGNSGTTANYNLIQGYVYNGINWSKSGAFVFNYNNFNIVVGGSSDCTDGTNGNGYWKQETNNHPPNRPSCTGNTYLTSSTSSGTTPSATPALSPSGGTFSGSQVVTFTNTGANRDANTGIWYTTDGSTPVPGAGTAQYAAGGQTISVTATTTVKAVGMWGARNQPVSYPSGYGYVPSPVVSATYTLSGSGTPTASTPVFSPASENFSSAPLAVSIAESTPGATVYYTSDGTTPTTASAVYSGPLSLSATTTVQAIAVASGYATSATGSASYTLTSSSPTLTGGYQTNSGNVNTLAVGAAPVQQIAVGTYSDEINRNLPDAYGNTAVWSSQNSAILQVTSSGLISCLASSSGATVYSYVQSASGVAFNRWGWTCTGSGPVTLSSVTLATTGGVNSIPYQATNQLLSSCHYSDGTITSCNTTDAHGNAVTAWSSSNSGNTPVSSSGVATGASVGSSNLTATVAGLSNPPLPLSVTSQRTLVGCYLGTPGSANTMTVGQTMQFSAYCTYSGSTPTQDCSVTDIYGDKVTSWSTSNSAAMTIQNIGGSTPGLASAVATGTSNAVAQINGAANSCNVWTVTVSAPAVTLTGISLATTGGVTGIFVGQTNQMVARCQYSDGSSTTCNTTDAHGNVASSFSSSNTAAGTINSATGLLTGAAAGTTNITAHAGTFTSPNLSVAVAYVPPGTYIISITGPVKVSGPVRF